MKLITAHVPHKIVNTGVHMNDTTQASNRPFGIGLYGHHGHQLSCDMIGQAGAKLAAIVDVPMDHMPNDIPVLDSLEELIAHPQVDLISLCSPMRCDQARDAIRVLNAGKHVYAEKPAALTEAELDEIVNAAQQNNVTFHEMSNTAHTAVYQTIARLIRENAIGQVVQVFAQKSYPWRDNRPDDVITDGGLIRQAALHGIRFVEYVAQQRIESVSAIETHHGHPRGVTRESAIAASMHGELQTGGIFTVIANYLNDKACGAWGQDTIRAFGTRGYIESTYSGQHTRMVADGIDHGPITTDPPPKPQLTELVEHITKGTPMIRSLDDELHPTRIALRAKISADEHHH